MCLLEKGLSRLYTCVVIACIHKSCILYTMHFGSLEGKVNMVLYHVLHLNAHGLKHNCFGLGFFFQYHLLASHISLMETKIMLNLQKKCACAGVHGCSTTYHSRHPHFVNSSHGKSFINYPDIYTVPQYLLYHVYWNVFDYRGKAWMLPAACAWEGYCWTCSF